MEQIMLVCGADSPRAKAVKEILEKEYSVTECNDMLETDSTIQRDFDRYACLVIDSPSTKEHLNYLFDYIRYRNNYMFSLPVLILTDNDQKCSDIPYLKPPVVDVIYDDECEKVILTRIKNVIKAANSSSFDDFSNMLTVLPSLIYLKDREGRYAFCSQHWHHLSDVSKSIRGLTDFDVRKDKNNAALARKSDLEVFETGKGKSYMIKEVDEEGTDYLQVIKEPLKNENDEVYGIIAIINNVTDQELLRQELREKSITDALTGLYNRVYFEEMCEKWKTDEPEYPLTFISADCDGLKEINDKFGHAAGDQYICYARDALKRGLPKRAFLFRMGGDEFLAAIPNTTKAHAKKLIEKINKAVPLFKNKKFALRLSVGSFTLGAKKNTIENAVMLSDEDMYRMKREVQAKKAKKNKE